MGGLYTWLYLPTYMVDGKSRRNVRVGIIIPVPWILWVTIMSYDGFNLFDENISGIASFPQVWLNMKKHETTT